jgi:hypothetical protein
MDKDETELAQQAIGALNAYSSGSERSQQAGDFRVGVSDLGFCQEMTRRMIIQEPLTDERQYVEAFLGTAIGDHAEAALAATLPGLRRGTSVSVHLEGDQGSYELPGHPDLLGDDIVIDLKTAAGLEKVRRTGPSQQQLFQRHLYALGASQAGLLAVPLEQVRTANIWFDRSGADHTAFAHIDSYNPDVVKAATAWLDDVVYAVRHGEEAMREPAREFCERYCPRYTACRALDTDVRGLLADPDVLAAVDIYREAGVLEKQAHAMRTEAQIALKGVQGSTGDYTVRWVNIPEGHVSYDRRAYLRLNVMRAKVKG